MNDNFRNDRHDRNIAKMGVVLSLIFAVFCLVGLLRLVDTDGVSPAQLSPAQLMLGVAIAIVTTLLCVQKLRQTRSSSRSKG